MEFGILEGVLKEEREMGFGVLWLSTDWGQNSNRRLARGVEERCVEQGMWEADGVLGAVGSGRRRDARIIWGA